jgi:hypothetical protein
MAVIALQITMETAKIFTLLRRSASAAIGMPKEGIKQCEGEATKEAKLAIAER